MLCCRTGRSSLWRGGVERGGGGGALGGRGFELGGGGVDWGEGGYWQGRGGLVSRGGGGVVGRGGENCGQQGPLQFFNFMRSLEAFSPEHFICNHWWQVEYWTDVDFKALLHMGQIQVGPGFCSIPARMSSSRIRCAGNVSFFVNQGKNSR